MGLYWRWTFGGCINDAPVHAKLTADAMAARARDLLPNRLKASTRHETIVDTKLRAHTTQSCTYIHAPVKKPPKSVNQWTYDVSDDAPVSLIADIHVPVVRSPAPHGVASSRLQTTCYTIHYTSHREFVEKYLGVKIFAGKLPRIV